MVQWRRTAALVSSALSVGVGAGMVAGRKLERDRWESSSSLLSSTKEEEKERGWRRLPALPAFATVSAAVPTTTGQLAPVPTTPAVPVPPREKESGLPPEPPPGTDRIAEIMRFGFPGFDNIRSHRDYVVSYDRRTRTPHWVFEHLTKDSVRRNEAVDRARSQFVEDKSVHRYFRATNEDYRYSGFDRGHLAAAGNHRQSQDVCDETFVLSNVAPQVGAGFNRDKWEHLERRVRSLTRRHRNVYVCTGPLYLPRMEKDGRSYVRYQVIGMNNVAVPTHFFKVVVCEGDGGGGGGDLSMEAYVMPNQPIPDDVPLQNFMVSPDSIERAAGLLFFDRLPRSHLVAINGREVKGGGG